MPAKNPLKVALEPVTLNFKKHLDNPVNKRILFSAPFGSGKSTFLQEYFILYKKKYTVLNLSPILYAVATNEDVFEYIKFDLLIELLLRYQSDLQITEGEFSFFLTTQFYILHKLKLESVIEPLLKCFDWKNEAVKAVYTALKQGDENADRYNKEMNFQEAEQAEKYFKWWEQEKGSIYERDQITYLIITFIKRLKEKFPSRPVILVIDDLDRLDPEHVFRLLNIFSAHYDPRTDINKFECDKVIIVCHYQNIKLMYANRYGEGVDFAGYMDKFYSTEIYNFDVRRHLQKKIFDLISDRYDKESFNALEAPYKDLYALKGTGAFYNALQYILICLIENKLFSFRNFDHFMEYCLPDERFIASNDNSYLARDFQFLVLIHLLRQFYPDLEEVERLFGTLADKFDKYLVISELSLRQDISKCEHSLIGMALYFLVDEHVVFENDQEAAHQFLLDPFRFDFTAKDSGKNYHILNYKKAYSLSTQTGSPRPNVFRLLQLALNNTRKRNTIF